MLLILIAVLAVFCPRLRGPRGDLASGTLLVTGVGPATGRRRPAVVTIAGIITGSTINEYAVSAHGPLTSTSGRPSVKYWVVYRRRILIN